MAWESWATEWAQAGHCHITVSFPPPPFHPNHLSSPHVAGFLLFGTGKMVTLHLRVFLCL